MTSSRRSSWIQNLGYRPRDPKTSQGHNCLHQKSINSRRSSRIQNLEQWLNFFIGKQVRTNVYHKLYRFMHMQAERKDVYPLPIKKLMNLSGSKTGSTRPISAASVRRTLAKDPKKVKCWVEYGVTWPPYKVPPWEKMGISEFQITICRADTCT